MNPETLKAMKEGDRVRLLADIWDDGQDHHPPGRLARKGEILIVRKLDPGHKFPVLISHKEITDQSFRVAESEIELADLAHTRGSEGRG
jgi:hypothetical protein